MKTVADCSESVSYYQNGSLIRETAAAGNYYFFKVPLVYSNNAGEGL